MLLIYSKYTVKYIKIISSSSSLTGKKSNELIQGGISSLKSAANTMAKKLDEIKEAISTSTTSTPVKVIAGDRLGAGDLGDGTGDCESTDGSEVGERHRRISAELGSYRGSNANLRDSDENLPESLYTAPADNNCAGKFATLSYYKYCYYKILNKIQFFKNGS